MTNSFKDRLRRLHDAHRRGKDTDEGPDGVYTARDAGDAADDPADAEPTGYGWQRLGAVENAKYGASVWIAEEICDQSQPHGDWTLSDCSAISHRRLTDYDREMPPDIRRGQMLYMDTETSGLGKDALAFMIGLGHWDGDDDFAVEQLMIEDEDDEPALLEAFSRRLAHRRVLVTFNGRRFDVPLLRRRYALHRMDDPFDDVHHCDLLPLCRRCFPGLSKYALNRLERDVLHFERVDDVPGREIPRRWWKFRKNRDAELMRGVLLHNRHDIVSMEALVAAVIADEAPRKDELPDESRWNLGRLAFKSLRPREHVPPLVPPQQEEIEEPEQGSEKPPGRISKMLRRSYRLRGRFADEPETGEERDVESAPSVPAAPAEPVAQPPFSAPADASGRIDDLRVACRTLIDRDLWREAFPLLTELVALVPDDDWAVERLADYYRRQGDEELASRLERKDR